MAILDNFNDPNQLRRLSIEELSLLATEIRDLIIDTTSRKGGHLSSSLGVVELTIALHFAFNTPKDKIIWDVGHQAYAHKILTGRRKVFDTIRDFEGISGFPRREESEHDAFGTGHSGTSISAAIGFALARKIKKGDENIIAVIGDGSMTSGIAFEGLNHAGSLNKKLIVVLNDNEMSISENVGALSNYLNKVMSDERVNKLKSEVDTLLKSIPGIGEKVSKFAHNVEDSIKLFIRAGRLFEDFGFKYIGPLDGHDLDTLIETFESAKKIDKPVLIHVLTTKGKGYTPAEKQSHHFHGAGKFERDTGNFIKKAGIPSYTSVFGKCLTKLAAEDEKIFAITAAMPIGTGLVDFSIQHPNQFKDVGIAEEHAVTMAAAMAAEGVKPVVAIYSTFLQRAYDQIIHDVALQELPVRFAIDRGGLVGQDGATHQGAFDLTYLRSIPNMVVAAPKDENELQHMLRTSLEYSNGPFAFRYPRGEGVGVELDEIPKALEVGSWEVLKEGKEAVILAVGNMVHPSLEAAKELLSRGHDVAVINARFVKPLDAKLLAEIAKTHTNIITAEENVLAGGFGAGVLEHMSDFHKFFDFNMLRIGIPDQFVEHGSTNIIASKLGLDKKSIIKKVRVFLNDASQMQEKNVRKFNLKNSNLLS